MTRHVQKHKLEEDNKWASLTKVSFSVVHGRLCPKEEQTKVLCVYSERAITRCSVCLHFGSSLASNSVLIMKFRPSGFFVNFALSCLSWARLWHRLLYFRRRNKHLVAMVVQDLCWRAQWWKCLALVYLSAQPKQYLEKKTPKDKFPCIFPLFWHPKVYQNTWSLLLPLCCQDEVITTAATSEIWFNLSPAPQ